MILSLGKQSMLSSWNVNLTQNLTTLAGFKMGRGSRSLNSVQSKCQLERRMWMGSYAMLLIRMQPMSSWAYSGSSKNMRLRGSLNHYLIEVGGHWIAWMPLSQKKPSPKEKSNFLIQAHSKVWRDLDMDRMGFMLVLNYTMSLGSKSIPDKMQSLLKDFLAISNSEAVAQLPLRGEIDHQIDFIPGSNLPHLPHYRLSPREVETLQQHVDFPA